MPARPDSSLFIYECMNTDHCEPLSYCIGPTVSPAHFQGTLDHLGQDEYTSGSRSSQPRESNASRLEAVS